jgi:hypothetical protein
VGPRLGPTSLGQSPPLLLPLVAASWCLGRGVRCTHPHYIKEGPRRRGTHNEPRDILSLSLVRHLHHLSLSYISHELPKGYTRVETTPPLHAVVLRSFWNRSEGIYFRNLGCIRDSEGRLDHRMCVYHLYVCEYVEPSSSRS